MEKSNRLSTRTTYLLVLICCIGIVSAETLPGFWYAYSDPKSKATLAMQLSKSENVSITGLNLANYGEIHGILNSSKGYVGIGYALNPNGLPVDVRRYNAITFYAKGDKRHYLVELETTSVKDYDYYQVNFIALKEGSQFVIPLSSFKQQGWGKKVDYSGDDVKAIQWVTNDGSLNQTFDLLIGNPRFTNVNTTKSVNVTNKTSKVNTNNLNTSTLATNMDKFITNMEKLKSSVTSVNLTKLK